MAFDGVTIACVISELKKELIGGRLYKIAQPENDELLLTIKQPTGQKRLLLSASASLPLIYLTETNKPSPMTAPNFCMLLRKHLQNGRIVNISQPGLERIVHIDIEHLDEMTVSSMSPPLSAASGKSCRDVPTSLPTPRTSWMP